MGKAAVKWVASAGPLAWAVVVPHTPTYSTSKRHSPGVNKVSPWDERDRIKRAAGLQLRKAAPVAHDSAMALIANRWPQPCEAMFEFVAETVPHKLAHAIATTEMSVG